MRTNKLLIAAAGVMETLCNGLGKKLPLPWPDQATPWLVIYALVAGAAYFMGAAFYSVLLVANALVSVLVGMIARSIGKSDAPAVLLGLLLGPLGALAGMIAAPQRQRGQDGFKVKGV